MKDGWFAISERVVSWEVPRGRGAPIVDERGEGGVGLEGVGGLRGVPGDPVDGDGIGGKGWESRFVFRGGSMTFPSTLRLDSSGIQSSSYSSVKASSPLEPVLLWPTKSLCWRVRPSDCLAELVGGSSIAGVGAGGNELEGGGGGGGRFEDARALRGTVDKRVIGATEVAGGWRSY
jgi:hypothetical protein